jgi:two-component system, chemotaxis family, CheB/CheR fusion protein
VFFYGDKKGRRDNLDPSASQTRKPQQSQESANEFFIVGIGASAGGLAAFEMFFTNLQASSGLAYVVVQHLSKNQKSILPEIIQRYTQLPVKQATDGVKVLPDHVYIIPPGSHLALEDGNLQLMKPEEGKGYRLPIDRFFRSLAQVQGPRAIGIVLSGTLSDGSLGVSYIKAEQGLTIAQDPETAEYGDMPRNAIATKDIDFVLPPEKMGEMIQKYIQHQPLKEYKTGKEVFPVPQESLQQIYVLIRSHTGHDFSQYKKNTVLRRIERRMRVCMVSDLPGYFEYIQDHPEEIEALVQELLINVTHFFRDLEAYQALSTKAIRPLIQQKQASHEPLRVWVAGCSSGEEAYSLAILIQEQIESLMVDSQYQIFATDIDEDSIAIARKGFYADGSIENVSQERLRRFFYKEDNGYQISKGIRDRVIFSTQNVITDPPFSRIDLLCCRNLLIYLEAELQKQLLQRFHYSLNPDGFLFLGNSESIGKADDLFEVLDRKQKIYQRKEGQFTDRIEHKPSPPQHKQYKSAEPETDQKRPKSKVLREWVEKELLGSHTPACVITDKKHTILYIHGRTGKYLEPRPGEPNNNLVLMAREGLKTHLATALYTAATTGQAVRQAGIQVRTNGGYQPVNLTIKQVPELPGYSDLLMVVFEEVMTVPGQARPASYEDQPIDESVAQLERSLNEKDEYLNSIIDELEKTNQDLKSANEELQSYNEEMQSTNEELETSKEELQSINEELTTINTELQTKNEELTRTNNDIHNLLDSTEIATILLDMGLCIRRFTPPVQQIYNLLPTDTGRSISHFESRLDYERLIEDIQEVINTLSPSTIEAQTRDGRWYLINIKPYRTVERVVDGAVVTFVDISQQKQTEQLRRMATILRDSNDAITVQDLNGQILDWNRGAAQMYGWSEAEALEMNVLDVTPEHKHQETLDLYKSLERGETIRSYETQRMRRDGRLIDVWMTLTALVDEANRPVGVASTERDITERKQTQQMLVFEKRSLLAFNRWYKSLLEQPGEEALLDAACHHLVEAGYRGVWIGKTQKDSAQTLDMLAWSAAEVDGETGQKLQVLVENSYQATQRALHSRRPVVTNNIQKDLQQAGREEQDIVFDYSARLILPLIHANQPLGILAIYAAEPDSFTEREVDNLQALAASLAQYGLSGEPIVGPNRQQGIDNNGID